MEDSPRFWVIFDTCTKQKYYPDLHHLLALPKGYIIRYEYRNEYLSDEALRAASSPKFSPRKVLLIYGQWKSFKKGDPDPESPPPEEMQWIATRFAEMQTIPYPEGSTYSFDLKVLGYPKSDTVKLEAILRPLINNNEVPFKRWVSISDHLSALEDIDRGEESSNWQDVVTQLSKPDIQFSGDSFWRIKEPFKGRLGKAVKPTYYQDIRSDSEMVHVRKINSVYDLNENEVIKLEIVSFLPGGEKLSSTEDRSISLDLSESGHIGSDDGEVVKLRSYRNELVHLRTTRIEGLDEVTGRVKFTTIPIKDGWPTGPEFEINFRVSKSKSQILFSLLFTVVGATLLFFAGRIDDNSILSLFLLILGGLLLIASNLILNGKLPVKI